MDKTKETGLTIKGMTLGQGMPIISVPVVEQKKEQILSEVNRLVSAGVKMIEFRADYYEDVGDLKRLGSLLREMGQYTENTILLFTLQSISQGGRIELPPRVLHDALMVAADCRAVDLVDVEFCEVENPKALIQEIHSYGNRVLTSQHDYMKTQKSNVMWELVNKMRQSGADVVKIAYTPDEAQDLLDLLSVTVRFHKEHPSIPIISMAMGNLGELTRISGEIFGSAVTFGKSGKSSAPGQIEYDRLKAVISDVHHSITGEENTGFH